MRSTFHPVPLSGLLLLGLALLLGGCVLTGGVFNSNQPINPSLTARSLLEAGHIFGANASDLVVPDASILAVDQAMTDFVKENTGWGKDSNTKLHLLLRGMVQKGLLSLSYDPYVTNTAQETFHNYTGNCLSFTNLFVALAREAGLNVKFQMIDVPPTWLGHDRLVILNNHINVRVRTPQNANYVVDFNLDDYKGNYAKREVSDDYARALYYSNIAVRRLTMGDNVSSFAYLRKSIQVYPRIPGPWVNLGVLFSRQGAYEEALAAYRHALKLDQRNKSALTNLVALYQQQGDQAKAAYYTRRLHFYRERNPYYHYSLARQALARSDYEKTLVQVGRAIKLKQNEHQFYYLQGLALYKTDRIGSAIASFRKANKYAQYQEIKHKYKREIAVLENAPGRS